MRKLRRMQASVVLMSFGIAGAAGASSIPVGSYWLTGVAVDEYQLTGSVTIGSGGLVNTADIKLNDAALGDPVFSNVGLEGAAGSAPVTDFVDVTDPGVGQLSLEYLPGLDSSGNVDLCVLSASNCDSDQVSYLQLYGDSGWGHNPVDLRGGTLEAAQTNAATTGNSATPEPGTLALVGTGILALAHLTKKRKRWG